MNRIIRILTALFYDHSFLTIFRFNFHKVDDNLYRSAQPNPYQIRKLVKKYGIRTIVNLRGKDNIAILELERETCRDLKVTLIEERFNSRSIPEFWRIKKAKEIFDTIEYPALIHCKAGADRTGLLATLYLHLKRGKSIQEAKKELRLIPYGHFNYARSGLIDFYFDKFLELKKENPKISLFQWSKDIDRKELEKAYKPNSFVSFFVDNILKRE